MSDTFIFVLLLLALVLWLTDLGERIFMAAGYVARRERRYLAIVAFELQVLRWIARRIGRAEEYLADRAGQRQGRGRAGRE